MPPLTTTSYAILGLLSIRPYSAYELAAQSQRSLRFTWPTAESRLYAEPKRLAAEGLIEVEQEAAGPTRTRQLYRITDAGRAALREWLHTEPSPPRAEFEFLLRVLYADAGEPDDLAAALETTRRQAQQLYDDGRELMLGYRDQGVPFPDRMHLNMVWAVFARELLQLILDWTAFAERELTGSPSDADPLEQGATPRAHDLMHAIIDGRPMRSIVEPKR